jgi:hypothetical protein
MGVALSSGEGVSNFDARVRLEDVAKINLFYLPLIVETRSRVAPNDLENMADIKVEITGPLARGVVRRLMEAVSKSGVQSAPVGTTFDVRWGINVYNKSGSRIYSLFVAGGGGGGYAQGAPYTSDMEIKDFFEKFTVGLAPAIGAH